MPTLFLANVLKQYNTDHVDFNDQQIIGYSCLSFVSVIILEPKIDTGERFEAFSWRLMLCFFPVHLDRNGLNKTF
jgi:hypothetical protein